MSKIKISGPVNIVRLEGKIADIDKVIYLFMDIHLDENEQTKCDGNSLQINEYFEKSFLQLNKENRMYDFFLEISPSLHSGKLSETDLNNIYIHNLVRFFKKWSPRDSTGSDNSHFKNIRFHYIDVRDIINYLSDYAMNGTKFWFLEMYSKNDFNPQLLYNIVGGLQFFKDELVYINKILQTDPHITFDKNKFNIFEELSRDVFDDESLSIIKNKSKYIIKKILTKYNHESIHNIMNGLISNEIVPYLSDLISKINKIFEWAINEIENKFISSQSDNDKKKILDDVSTTVFLLMYECRNYMVFIMDLYFLRRFLDKDYITNAICYTGSAHSINYINILVNLFNFKITNVSYAITNDINEINKLVKQQKTFFDIDSDITKIFLPNDDNIIQCSDISDFPSNFL
jgi:hypothetical protein